ncbi:DNA ligase 1 [Epargyreus clarus]|uniref:DNA ligase 1 n=1 Tax=Epargyreus clarus TaxID=520877 RepID=UPI003C2E4F0B
MNGFTKLFKTCRVVSLPIKHHCISNRSIPHSCNVISQILSTHVNVRTMAQKSITSFFKITPKKSQDPEERPKKDESFTNDEIDSSKSPTPNGTSKHKSSKRLRSDSEGSDSSKKSSSPVSSVKKKKVKRQRIDSSASETDTPKKVLPSSPENIMECETAVKLEKDKPKTYESPKSKKAKGKQKIKEDTSPKVKKSNSKKSPSPKSVEVKQEQFTPKGKEKVSNKGSPPIKEEDSSPETKENGDIDSNTSPSPNKTEDEKDTPPKKKNPFEFMKVKGGAAKENGTKKKVENKEKDKENEKKDGELVAEAEYNPAKSKYHPIKDACWSKGQAVPYLALAKTLEAIEATSARLKMVEILSNYLRSVIALTPEDLLASIYMCLNQLAPAYHNLELGIAETYLMKAVGQCTGRTLAQTRAAARRAGDLGRAAELARSTQRTVRAPPPLAARHVLRALQDIARISGQASVNKKISKIQSLYVACRHSEARFLIRSLEGKLRVGLAEQSLLQALALAAAATPPAGPRAGALDVAADMGPDLFKARVDEFALTIKTTYCECPNYELIVPVLLQHGVEALPQHCRLTPGIPLKPMLAHPTRGVSEVFNRFENEQFTCEYKYDGERAQIHVPGDAAPLYDQAAIFSRNQENNTGKYPDILSRLPTLLKDTVTSCVLDCEAVAYDIETKQILPFQVLSTRKRRAAAAAAGGEAAAPTVQVCVFVFDLLYLNGAALVRRPLAERRRLLREHFQEQEGTWQFAKSRDCSTTEEVQQFLEEAVRGSCEGLMVKTLLGDHARYDIARRSHNWLKLKKDYLEGVGDTVDVVVIGGYFGKGKRSGNYGGFLLACYDPDSEEYQSLCKIGTGFTDEDLRTLSETLQQHVIDGPKNYYRYDNSHAPDAWFAAARVWEVRCADLSLSPAHRAAGGLVHRDKGVSLRFPRFIRVREDKTPEQATTAQQIAELYLAQDQVKNQGTKKLTDDDFY